MLNLSREFDYVQLTSECRFTLTCMWHETQTQQRLMSSFSFSKNSLWNPTDNLVYLSVTFYVRQVKAAEEDNVNAKSESVETRKALEQVTKEESELAAKVRQ